MALKPMTAGSEVVEDYRHVGLTLRRYTRSRSCARIMQARRIVTCEDAMQARDGRWLEGRRTGVGASSAPAAPRACCSSRLRTRPALRTSRGLAADVREIPAGSWMGASMLAVCGRVQREGEVVH